MSSLRFTLVLDTNAWAIYRKDTGSDQNWRLVTHGTGDGTEARKTATVIAPQDVEIVEDASHVIPRGTVWPNEVHTFRRPQPRKPTTPAEMVQAEIQGLMRDAERVRQDAAFGGRFDDGGAHGIEAQAGAMQRALDLMEGRATTDALLYA